MDRTLKARLEARLSDHLRAPVYQRHDRRRSAYEPGSVPEYCRTLHDALDLRFEILADLAGVDTGALAMQVVYHLWSPMTSTGWRVIADGISRDDPRAPSATFLWIGAEWLEREAYDMYGIVFEGQPRPAADLHAGPTTRVFPLRKDFLLPDDAARSPGAGVRRGTSSGPRLGRGGRSQPAGIRRAPAS